METNNDKVRLDKWLWAARFFKTRSLAAEAVNGGKIHVNGNRAKAAHGVRIGDHLRIRKGPYEFMVTIQDVSERRGPASVAALLYEESEESRAARALLSEQRRLVELATPRPSKRPDKKQRRQLSRFTGKN